MSSGNIKGAAVAVPFWLFLAVFRRSCAGEVAEDLAEVVLGIEADHTADGGYGVAAVLELLYCDVDPDRVEELDRGLPELLLEEVVEGRLADTAFLGEVCDSEAALPIARYVLDGRLQSLVYLHVARLHLDYNALQEAIKARICLECLKLSAREKLCDVNNVALLGLADVDYLRLVLIALIMHKATQIHDLDARVSIPLGVAIYVLGNKYHVSLSDLKLLVQINIRSASAHHKPDAGFSFITVSATEMILIKSMP